jgi:hypothetical protein
MSLNEKDCISSVDLWVDGVGEASSNGAARVVVSEGDGASSAIVVSAVRRSPITLSRASFVLLLGT